MAFTVDERLMEAGTWSLDLDWSPTLLDELTEEVNGKRRPKLLHGHVYDPAGTLMYLLVLRSITGDEKGLTIGGPGFLWHLGSGDIGKLITDREYISGTNKLSNGGFDLDQADLYWRLPSEDSTWAFTGGNAVKTGATTTDDILESDEKFPTRPGHSYRALASGVTGAGKLRLRIVFEGQFRPANLLDDPSFEGTGAWTETANITLSGGLMRISNIPKPQLVVHSTFAGGLGWTRPATIGVLNSPANAYGGGTWVMALGPNIKPQILINSNLELGPGYPWNPPDSGDIGFVNDATKARSGTWVIKVGPITQKQLLLNPQLSTGGGSLAALGTERGGVRPAATEGVLTSGESRAAMAELLTAMAKAPPKVGLAEGARGRDVAVLQTYLARYGYLQPDIRVLASSADEAEFDAATTEALKDFQRFYKLRVTGTFTKATRDLMKRPRCGVPDRRSLIGPSFVPWEGHPPFQHRNLSYKFTGYVADISEETSRVAVADACSKWAAVTDLTFTLDHPAPVEDRDISFHAGGTDPEGALARCFEDNSIVFYDNHTWQVTPVSAGNYDFTTTAIHEIGHALGLDHTPVTSAIMYAFQSDGDTSHELDPDDIAGIQSLYPAQGTATFPYWLMSSEAGEPDPGLFYPHSTDGVDNGPAATTDGGARPRVVKYMRADYDLDSGVTEHPVRPGEEWEFTAWVRRSPSANGHAYISLAFPHPDDIPAAQRWHISQIADNRLEGEKRQPLSVRVTVPDNRTEVNPLMEVHDHSAEYWSFSQPRLIRTRGNRDRMTSVAYPLTPHTSYRLQANMNSGNDHQVGTASIGIVLTNASNDSEQHAASQGHTDYRWTRRYVDFTPGEGFVQGTPYIGGDDIIGDPIYLDDLELIQTSNNTAETTDDSFAVVPDQRYLLAVPVRSDDDVTRGKVTVGVRLTGPGLATVIEAVDQEATENEWLLAKVEFKPPPGYTTATPFARSTDIEGGWFYIGRFETWKMDNNTDTSAGTVFTVTPERTYRWEESVFTEANLQRGTVTLSARCIRSGHDDIIFDSSPMEGTKGEVKRLTFDFTPPSGYEQVEPRIIFTDIEGGIVAINDGDLRDTDSTTVVYDAATINPTGAGPFTDATAPAGAKSVWVQLVAESGSTPWTVNSVSLARTGVTPATGNAIIADLLAGTSITAGTLSAPAVIPYDWHILNLTLRQALDHLCNVVYDPPLEYRFNPVTRSLDVGPAATVFTDHEPDSANPIVLLPEDPDVEDIEPPTMDIEDRPTEIMVIGARRRTVSGQDILITATAQVPGAAETDWNGNPVVRTKIVSDGTVDHFGYAQALADDLAAREADPALTVTATLNEIDATTAAVLGIPVRPPSNVGDWDYVWEPAAGLEDETYTTTIEGQTVKPRRARILGRRRELGPKYSVQFRRLDGTMFEPDGVIWSEKDSTTLTMGDRLPEWQADPQGMAPGLQYVRDRASAPR